MERPRKWGPWLAVAAFAAALIGLSLHVIFLTRPLSSALLLGLPFGLIILARLCALPAARWIADRFAALLLPDGRFDRPQPIYSIPEACAVRGEIEAALGHYRRIAAEHPAELRPWREMMELTWHVLRDEGRTRALLAAARDAHPGEEESLDAFWEDLRAGRTPNRFRHLRPPS